MDIVGRSWVLGYDIGWSNDDDAYHLTLILHHLFLPLEGLLGRSASRRRLAVAGTEHIVVYV